MARYTCPKCGSPLYGTETHCAECGVRLEFESSSSSKSRRKVERSPSSIPPRKFERSPSSIPPRESERNPSSIPPRESERSSQSRPTREYERSSQSRPSNNWVNMDEGDNEAENILRSVVNVIKILIIIFSAILGLVGVIGGCIMLSQNGAGFFVILAGIIIALIGYFFAKLVWAVGMIFINISTNVRTIKKQLQNRG